MERKRIKAYQKDEFLDARQVEINKEVDNIKLKVEDIKKIQEKVVKIEEEKKLESGKGGETDGRNSKRRTLAGY